MIGQELSSKHYFASSLETSKGTYNRWGRQVIEAIGVDNCVKLIDVYSKYSLLGANVNEQVDMYGYAGYIWTLWNHQYLGDTALHIALKQKKINCICQLLLMDGLNINIVNASNETPDILCQKLFGISILDFAHEARNILYQVIDPRSFHQLPHSLKHFRIEEESWDLMRAGRSLYVETPESFHREVIKNRESAWMFRYTKFKGPFMENRFTKEVRKLSTKEAYWFNRRWQEKREKSGWKIYTHELTGETVDGDDMPDTILYQLNNPYEDNEDEKMRKVNGQLEKQHIALLNAQKDLILSSCKPNKYNAVTPLARHEPLEINIKQRPTFTVNQPEISFPPDERLGKQPLGSPMGSIDGSGTEFDRQSSIGIGSPHPDQASVGSIPRASSPLPQSVGSLGSMPRAASPSPLVIENAVIINPTEPGSIDDINIPNAETDGAQDSPVEQDTNSVPKASQTNPSSPNKILEGSVNFSIDSMSEINNLQEEGVEIPLDNNFTTDNANQLDGRIINIAKLPKAKCPISEVEYLQEYYSGNSSTPAFLGTGDVWGRGTISDVISLVRKQKLRQQKRDLAELKKKSGLGLLESSGDVGFFFQNNPEEELTSTRPDQEIFGSHQMKLRQMQEPLADRLLKQLPELKGIGKLRFVKMKELTAIATEEYADDNKKSTPLPSDSVPISSRQSGNNNKSAKNQGYARIESEQPPSIEEELAALNEKRDALHLPERVIHCLSTAHNMKYMHVGNKGLEMLAKELQHDVQITSLVLSCARISCTGIVAFASYFESIRGLTYLDLSQNGIADEGACALAEALTQAAIEKQVISDSVLSTEPVMQAKHPLETLILSANRITMVGATILVDVLLYSGGNLKKLSLFNNKIGKENEESLMNSLVVFNAGAIERYEKTKAANEEAERLRLEELSRKASKKKHRSGRSNKSSSLSTKFMNGVTAVFDSVGTAMSSRGIGLSSTASNRSNRSISPSGRGWLPFLGGGMSERSNNVVNDNDNGEIPSDAAVAEETGGAQLDHNGEGKILETDESKLEANASQSLGKEKEKRKPTIKFRDVEDQASSEDDQTSEKKYSLRVHPVFSSSDLIKYNIKFLSL